MANVIVKKPKTRFQVIPLQEVPRIAVVVDPKKAPKPAKSR
jgi:hypothetical protein